MGHGLHLYTSLRPAGGFPRHTRGRRTFFALSVLNIFCIEEKMLPLNYVTKIKYPLGGCATTGTAIVLRSLYEEFRIISRKLHPKPHLPLLKWMWEKGEGARNSRQKGGEFVGDDRAADEVYGGRHSIKGMRGRLTSERPAASRSKSRGVGGDVQVRCSLMGWCYLKHLYLIPLFLIHKVKKWTITGGMF